MGVFDPEATAQGPASPEGQSSAGMGDVVNLRRARKQAGRQVADRNAANNRLLHGRSKAERELDTLRKAKAQRELDRHRIVTEDER
jgi:Domain of unknown function (DUF4169)